MAKLEGKVALITGAAVGLGEGIAEVYAKYGAKMCMVDLSPEVEKTADRLRKEYGADIITYVGNVADKAQMKEAAAKTAGKVRRNQRMLLQRWCLPSGSLRGVHR